jgi:hypothetical protein
MVLEIFQLSISDETHLKRLKRLEIYWKFLSPGVSVSTAGHISREISRHSKSNEGSDFPKNFQKYTSRPSDTGRVTAQGG